MISVSVVSGNRRHNLAYPAEEANQRLGLFLDNAGQ